jgi:hypothetical protein
MSMSNDEPKSVGEFIHNTNGAIRLIHGATSHRRNWIQVDLATLVEWAKSNPSLSPVSEADIDSLMPTQLGFVGWLLGKKSSHNESEAHKRELRAALARAFLGKSYIIENHPTPETLVLAGWNGSTDLPGDDELLPWVRG